MLLSLNTLFLSNLFKAGFNRIYTRVCLLPQGSATLSVNDKCRDLECHRAGLVQHHKR